MSRVQLHEELIWEILEEIWNSSLSNSERILLMKSSPLVSKSWSIIFAKITSRDVHIPSAGYLHRYLEITQPSLTFHEFGDSLNDICKSITIDPQKNPGAILADLLYKVKRTHTNLHTLRLVYDRFSIDDIFDYFQFVDIPGYVKNLELRFVDGAMKLGDETVRYLSDLKFDTRWNMPYLRRLSIIGGDERVLRHYLRALVCQNMTILETDFSVNLEDLDLKTSYPLSTTLKHHLITSD